MNKLPAPPATPPATPSAAPSAASLSMPAAVAVGLIALSSVGYGLVPLFARQLQAVGIDDAMIALYRFVLTAAVLAPFLRLGPRATSGQLRQLWMTLGVGMAMGLGWIGYLRALEAGPIAAAGVVYMSYPVFAMGFAWLILGQRPGPRSLLAAAMVLAAALVMTGGGFGTGGVDPRVLLFSLPAPVTFGLMVTVIGALTPDLGVLTKIAAASLGAVVGLAPLAIGAEVGDLIPVRVAGWGAVLALGVITALIPQLVFAWVAPRLGPGRAAVAATTELPVMVLVAWTVFAEVPGLRDGLAVALVLTAVLIVPAARAGRAGRRRV